MVYKLLVDEKDSSTLPAVGKLVSKSSGLDNCLAVYDSDMANQDW
jgi:hypothetical protein